MIKLLFLLLPLIAEAESLRSILEYATQNNNNIKSSKLIKDAKLQEVESKKSSYFPTIDIGASYTNTSDITAFGIKDVYAGYAKAEFYIYDGGERSALVQKAQNELSSSIHDELDVKKGLSLEIAVDYYNILSLKSSLMAKEDAKRSLQEQLERVKQFRGVGLATRDDVERLRASYERSLYEIESIRFEFLELKRSLELKIGKEIESFDKSVFKEAVIDEIERLDAVESLVYKERAFKSSADAIGSVYYPKVKAEDTYTVYEYGDIAQNHPLNIDKQNVFMLTLNMRLFDYGVAEEERESLLLNAKALSEKIKYLSKEQKLRHDVSIERIKSAKIKIKSAKSALVAAISAFGTINEKYNAGIVDYIIYLNALSAKTDADALFERSLNELQIAYAMYYFYSGRDLEEFIQ